MIRRPPSSPLFPYTPLSRSDERAVVSHPLERCAQQAPPFGEMLGQRCPGLVVGIGQFRSQRTELAPPQPAPQRAPLHHRRSEEHTSELQSQSNLVCRLLLEK